jgi:Fe-S oxidoreductase
MASLMLGMPLFLALRDPAIEFAATECNICRLQMEQGSEKSVYHPVHLLAHAYGFMMIPQLN